MIDSSACAEAAANVTVSREAATSERRMTIILVDAPPRRKEIVNRVHVARFMWDTMHQRRHSRVVVPIFGRPAIRAGRCSFPESVLDQFAEEPPPLA